jgi:hypothetical protein
MDGAWLARLRWRWRGALLWPTYVGAIAADGLIGHARPPVGTGQSLGSALLVGLVATLPAVLLLSRPLGAILRRRRTDMPVTVARNYAGTAAVLTVTALILFAGLVHHPAIAAQQRVLDEAIARAEAFIGDRAPAEFRVNAYHTDTFAIQPGAMYRTCVPSRYRPRYYCVIVKVRLPLEQSVVFDGYEPNATFAQGVN